MMRVLGGGSPEVPLPDFCDAYETQRALEAIALSAEHGTRVRLDEVK
jgi:predicted dehydrogenase